MATNGANIVSKMRVEISISTETKRKGTMIAPYAAMCCECFSRAFSLDTDLKLRSRWYVIEKQEEIERLGLPPMDESEIEDAVRKKHLREGAPAPDLATLKDFVRFYCKSSRGTLSEDREVTADSTNTFMEWFFAGFTRVTKTPTDPKDRSEIYHVSCGKHLVTRLTQLT